ncbi:hypothetical protein RRG08_015129 [Elysia crispata]|uniref:Uncharacterized protein n=1 Tax=Elysia crispata TaxID=231223 RepID=A0AAE1AAJ1_9GAST|nr:hypothetical protein RRG08_015129 [Elysia crispata]
MGRKGHKLRIVSSAKLKTMWFNLAQILALPKICFSGKAAASLNQRVYPSGMRKMHQVSRVGDYVIKSRSLSRQSNSPHE